MQANQGGDGIVMGPTGEAPIETAAPITGERSESQAELETKIEQELGLPHVESTQKTEAIVEAEPVVEEGAEAEETVVEPEGEEEEQPVVAPEPATPTDEELFIEVEDAEGVVHKISQIEDLPEDFVAKNNRQGYEILHELSKLDSKIEARDAQIAKEAAAAEQTAVRQQQFTAWDNEIAELHKEKRIDPTDTERVGKVFEHIAKVNDARAKAGNPNLLTSFEDGLDKFEAFEAKEAANDKKKQDNERAKAKASLIGGTNSTGAGSAQPYFSGRYRSMDDVPV